MVEDVIRDPDRIAALLRAELEGLEEPPFDQYTVQSTAETEQPGTPAFSVTSQGETVLKATKGPERLTLEIKSDPETVAIAAEEVGLRSRPKATQPPATVLFVDRAADVKRAIDVLRASQDSQ